MPDNKQLTPAEAAAAQARTEVDGFKALVAMTGVETAAEYEIANKLLTSIRDAEVAHEAERVKITQPLNAALRAVNALFKPLAAELAEAKSTLSGKMIVFTRAETARREAQERAAEEQHRRDREAAEARLAEATQAAVDGAEGAAEALEEASVAVAMAEVATALPSTAPPPDKGGHATRKRYLASISNEPALLRHLAALIEAGDRTLEGVVDYKMGKLNTLGTNTQGSLRIPGVTFTADEKIVARKSTP